MNYTTNFNLNKPEGTDLYNHLTIDNPNMDTIDAAMQANKLASVGNATELVSGTVHAITRSDSKQNIFKFKATGDFKKGDTITVDGVSVNAYTTGGQQLLDDAYVLSAQVLCILDGTSLWVLVNKDQDAEDVYFDNTLSDLTATDVQGAIDEIHATNNITITSTNGTFSGDAFTNNAIGFVGGAFTATTNINSGQIIMTLSENAVTAVNYIGLNITSGTMLRGYIVGNTIYQQGTISSGETIIFELTFRRSN